MNGFFDKLIEFVDSAVQEGFVRKENRNNFVSSSDPKDLIESLKVFSPLRIDSLHSLELTIERITQSAWTSVCFTFSRQLKSPNPSSMRRNGLQRPDPSFKFWKKNMIARVLCVSVDYRTRMVSRLAFLL